MNKEYMERLIKDRLQILQERYKAACSCHDEQGKELTSGNAAAVRTQCKRDMQILNLLYALLGWVSKDMFISDEDMITNFHRLVEPIERYRNKR